MSLIREERCAGVIIYGNDYVDGFNYVFFYLFTYLNLRFCNFCLFRQFLKFSCFFNRNFISVY